MKRVISAIVLASLCVGGGVGANASGKAEGQNKKPVAAVSGIDANTAIAVGESITVTVSGTDEDGTIEKTALVIDGERSEQQGDKAEYVLENIAEGRHEIYAEVTDNDGAVSQSGIYGVTAVVREQVITDDALYGEDSTKWKELDTSNGSIVEEDGNSYIQFTSDGITTYLYNTGDLSFTEQTTYFELDFNVSDTKTQSSLIAIRGSTAEYYDYGIVIQNGTLGGYPIEANKWYHVKYSWNMKEKLTKLWVLEENGYKLVKENPSMKTDGVYTNMRMMLNQSKTAGYSIALDNLCLYHYKESPYITNIEYLDKDGSSVFANGEVGYALDTIRLSFNNDINTESITDDTIKIFVGDSEVTDYEVSYADKKMLIKFGMPVKTFSSYRVEYSGLADVNKANMPKGVISFKTGAEAYDVLEWTVNKDGSPIELLNNIKKGDELVLSADMVNTTGTQMDSKLIFVVYSGDKAVGISITDINVPEGGGVFSSTPLTVTGTIDDTVSVRGFVWSSVGADRNIQIQGFRR